MDRELHAQTKLPRRRFLRDTMLTTVASAFASPFVSACQVTSGREVSTSLGVDTMDQALEMMAHLAPLTNHGPRPREVRYTIERHGSGVSCKTALTMPRPFSS
jgi:hypothetical protein